MLLVAGVSRMTTKGAVECEDRLTLEGEIAVEMQEY
jgi:hypothetical protein